MGLSKRKVIRRLQGGNISEHQAPPTNVSTDERSNGSSSSAAKSLLRVNGETARQSNPKNNAGQVKRCCSRLFTVVKYIIFLVIIPPFVNYASLQREHKELIPHDALRYDIGRGQMLMLRCTGKGAPTVVLECPAGLSSDVWLNVAASLQKKTRVCTYDRAGIGFSDRPILSTKVADITSQKNGALGEQSKAFTVERMADDLKRLLNEVSTQPKPFILVGAELGALVARFYAHMYDEDVAALILVDPLSSSLYHSSEWLEHWRSNHIFKQQVIQLLASSGLTRLGLLTGVSRIPQFWSDIVDQNVTTRQMHLACHPKHHMSASEEASGVDDSLMQIKMLGKVKPFPKDKIVAIMRQNTYEQTAGDAANRAWRDAGERLITDLQLSVDQVRFVSLDGGDSIQDILLGTHSKKIQNLIVEYVMSYREKTKSRAM